MSPSVDSKRQGPNGGIAVLVILGVGGSWGVWQNRHYSMIVASVLFMWMKSPAGRRTGTG